MRTKNKGSGVGISDKLKIPEEVTVLAIFLPGNYYKQNRPDTKPQRKDTMRILFLSLLILAALASCATEKNRRDNFEKSFKTITISCAGANSRMRAASCRHNLRRIQGAAEDRRKYRSGRIPGQERKIRREEEEAEVKIEIDYYTFSSTGLRTVLDNEVGLRGERRQGLLEADESPAGVPLCAYNS
jgi:hypothetical protein